MDQIFHMKDIIITENQIPVNVQQVRIYALVIEHGYIWNVYLLITFQTAVLF